MKIQNRYKLFTLKSYLREQPERRIYYAIFRNFGDRIYYFGDRIYYFVIVLYNGNNKIYYKEAVKLSEGIRSETREKVIKNVLVPCVCYDKLLYHPT